jgi:hypothetical protein
MDRSGLTSATLQELRRKAQSTAGISSIEKEIEMVITDEPEEFSDISDEPEEVSDLTSDAPSDDIAPDLPGEPWGHDWVITDPIVDEPTDNTERNLRGRKQAYDIRNYYEEHVPDLERPRGPVDLWVDVDLWDLGARWNWDVEEDQDMDHYQKMIEADLTEALNLGEDHHLVVRITPTEGAVEVTADGVYPDMKQELESLIQKLTYQSAIDVAKSYGGQGEEIIGGGMDFREDEEPWEKMTTPGLERDVLDRDMADPNPEDEYYDDYEEDHPDFDSFFNRRSPRDKMTGSKQDAAMVRRVLTKG